ASKGRSQLGSALMTGLPAGRSVGDASPRFSPATRPRPLAHMGGQGVHLVQERVDLLPPMRDILRRVPHGRGNRIVQMIKNHFFKSHETFECLFARDGPCLKSDVPSPLSGVRVRFSRPTPDWSRTCEQACLPRAVAEGRVYHAPTPATTTPTSG